MKHNFKYILALLLGGIIFNACSTKKNKGINRSWHAMNTKFNVLYNGNLALDAGSEELNASYIDDYWEILPIERLTIVDEIRLDSEGNNSNFEKAEEKAKMAIQKHSMDILDIERNPQTDEAFLLLGKARYYDQRFIPALEAFNYILRKYYESDKLNEATIWREKVNIRLENDELALENLKKLLKQEYLKEQEYADARAVMAQAYINLNIPDTAIQQLKIASAYTKKSEEKGRYYFIMGQLYNQLGHKDSSNLAYDEVIALNRRSPRVYMINAHLKKIQNTRLTVENNEEMLAYLTDLEDNRENRPFLDKIYRQVALFHMDMESDSLSLAYYNKSIQATQGAKKLNAKNYEDLANYYFDQNNYKISGAYYDSVLTNLAENTRKHRAIKKKLDNLEDVIKYEEIVQVTDSVLSLYYMPKEAQTAYFEKHIEEIKRKAEEAAKAEEERTTKGIVAFGKTKGGKKNKGKFYFYNVTSLGYGKNDFKTRWGNRTLEDNWRWANKNRTILVNNDEVVTPQDGEEQLTENQKYSVDFYLDQIPTDVKVIDSLEREHNFANYQLGLIYKEKFKENLLAAEKLENVLASNPEERLIIPSKYNLYKIYEESGSPLALEMKQNIIKNHSGSRYAEILLNPQAILQGDIGGPDAKYTALYQLYKEQKYLNVITQAQENINRYTGDEIVPKFEMLKANAIGKLEGFIEFKEALSYVALNYPNNPEGKKAQQMVDEQLPKLETKEFLSEKELKGAANWKVVFPFKIREEQRAAKLTELLNKSIEDLKYKNIVSKDRYTLEDQFIVVHGFSSKDRALGYAELLKNNKDYRVNDDNFVILSDNYKIVQVHKNLQEYKKQL